MKINLKLFPFNTFSDFSSVFWPKKSLWKKSDFEEREKRRKFKCVRKFMWKNINGNDCEILKFRIKLTFSIGTSTFCTFSTLPSLVTGIFFGLLRFFGWFLSLSSTSKRINAFGFSGLMFNLEGGVGVECWMGRKSCVTTCDSRLKSVKF